MLLLNVPLSQDAGAQYEFTINNSVINIPCHPYYTKDRVAFVTSTKTVNGVKSRVDFTLENNGIAVAENLTSIAQLSKGSVSTYGYYLNISSIGQNNSTTSTLDVSLKLTQSDSGKTITVTISQEKYRPYDRVWIDFSETPQTLNLKGLYIGSYSFDEWKNLGYKTYDYVLYRDTNYEKLAIFNFAGIIDTSGSNTYFYINIHGTTGYDPSTTNVVRISTAGSSQGYINFYMESSSGIKNVEPDGVILTSTNGVRYLVTSKIDTTLIGN